MYHHDVKLNVKGPTGWSPLQDTISYVIILFIEYIETYKTNS